MAKRLTRQLGLIHVFAISAGAMISSGLFVLPGIAASQVGPAAIVAYLLSGVLVIPSLLSQAELSTAMPRAGGTYFFVSRSLGPMFGTIDGVGVWLTLVFKGSIALVGIGAYLAVYIGVPLKVIAVAFCLLFMVVNLLGSRGTSRVQVLMVGFLLALLAVLVGGGLPAVKMGQMTPFAPFGWRPLLPVTAMVFVSYIGLTKVAGMAEEVENPSRNIPYGMLLALIVVMAIYGFVVWVIVGVVPADTLHRSLTPLSDAGTRVLGPAGAHLICVAGLLAFATTGNASLMAASRYVLAMSRDHAIPHGLSRLSSRGEPRNAILLTTGVVLIIVTTVGLEQIAKLASTFQLLEFALINVAVIVMRESGIGSYDPNFRSPFYPYVQLAGILIAVVLIPKMGLMSSMFSLGLLGVGVAWQYLYVRHRVMRVGAVVQVAQRIAERLLRHDAEVLGLDRELREILKEKGLRRDDPFADVVGRAEVLDMAPDEDMETLLKAAAEHLAIQSGVSGDLIQRGLLERSRLGETPAEAGVALPHLLLDDVDTFHLVIVRSVCGIDFAAGSETIHAAFVLLGDRKNPTQHLRCLAELARRAEMPDFIDQWEAAESASDLKALLITG